LILSITVSKGNVAKRLTCDEAFYCKFTAESEDERILITRQHNGEVMGKSVVSCFFLIHGVHVIHR